VSVPENPLGSNRRNGLLHDRGLDRHGAEERLRAVHNRVEHTARTPGRHYQVSERYVDGSCGRASREDPGRTQVPDLRLRRELPPSLQARDGGRGYQTHQDTHRALNANAYAERFVRSIKEECLSKMILFGEGHLRCAADKCLHHFIHERNHQGIGNELVDAEVASGAGPIECRERLGGLLKFYHRAA
jgi:hypothetical protein